MRSRSWRIGLAAALAAVLVGGASCAHRPPMVAQSTVAPCRQVVPAQSAPVAWTAPDDTRDLDELVRWCRTVGPLVVEAPAEPAPADALDWLPILSWNVHVGGGDIGAIVGQLRRGELTGGRPAPHFVLLLQEAYREGNDVPQHLDADSPVPRGIVETPPTGVRRDISTVARLEGLYLFYAPSMRNQRDGSDEDRGTAILSTLPLADLQVIELPFERQRRVALAATVTGRGAAGDGWRLRVAAVQVDTALALTRGGPFAARKRQTEALVEALAMDEAALPMIVGGDFNTWLGPKEPALAVMRRAFPETPAQPVTMTWRGPVGMAAALDYVFARGDFRSLATHRLPDRFGSDHYPLLTVVDF